MEKGNIIAQMAETVCALQKKYQSVRVFLITWDIDGISVSTRELGQIFREVYHYSVHEICLSVACQSSIWDLIHSTNNNELWIFYYFGDTEINLRDDWDGITLVPLSHGRQGRALDFRPGWPESWIGIPHLSSDILLILDCFLDGFLERFRMSQGNSSWTRLDLEGNHISFELIAADYRDRSTRPGAFSSYMARSLKMAATRSHNTSDRKFPSTDWLRRKISEFSYFEGQIIQPFHTQYHDNNESVPWICLCPNTLPFVETALPDAYDRKRLFENEMLIYKNGMTEVFKARIITGSGFGRNNDVNCVVKRFRPRNKMQVMAAADMFKRERECLLELSAWRHRHILELLDSYEEPSEFKFGHWDLVLPYAEGGDLYQFLRLPAAPERFCNGTHHVPLCQAIYIQAVGVVDALAFIHSKVLSPRYIIHRDIKPSNILIHNGAFKITDFGLSSLKSNEETSKTEWLAGTPIYAPPERVVEGLDDHGRPRDVWALGCVLLEILTLLVYGFSETPAVELFEEERLKSSQKLRSKAFCLTMESVDVWMAKINKDIETENRNQEDRLDWKWGARKESLWILLGVIQNMLKVDPLERIESSHVLNCLTEANESVKDEVGKKRKKEKRNDPSRAARMEISVIGSCELTCDQGTDRKELKVSAQGPRVYDSTLECLKRHQNDAIVDFRELQMPCRPKANHHCNRESRALHLAARNGHLSVVELLLGNGANPNFQDEAGATALHMAAGSGSELLTELLLSKGADVKIRSKYGMTALHFAAYRGNETVMRILLNNSADPADSDDGGMAALHYAAKSGDGDSVQLLLQQENVNINTKCCKGLTAMSYAARRGHLTVVKILLNKELASNGENAFDLMPLYFAVAYGQESIVELLLKQQNIDLEPGDKDPLSFLEIAADKGQHDMIAFLINRGARVNGRKGVALTRAANNGHEAVVQLLLDSGADANLQDRYGYTPLCRAASEGHKNIVRLLLDSGADMNLQDSCGFTALCRAASEGHENVVGLLLDSGADVNLQDSCGFTALFWAATKGHESVVGLLLDSGADVNLQDSHGFTALCMAASQGHESVVRTLLQEGANTAIRDENDWTILHWAAVNGHHRVVKFLLEIDMDPLAVTSENMTPLYGAATEGESIVVQVLMEKIENISNFEGYRVLVMSIDEGNWGIADLLLKRIDVNVQNADGRTALHQMAAEGNEEAVRFLLEKRADWSVRNKGGKMPLHYAARGGYEQVARLLLAAGANLEIKDDKGLTPLDYSAENGHVAIVKLILETNASRSLLQKGVHLC